MSAVRQQRTLLGRSWRYTVIGALCAAGNYAVMLTVDLLGGHYLLGMLLGFSVIAPVGYALHSRFTFCEPYSLKAFIRFSASLVAAYPIATIMMIALCSGLQLTVAIAAPIATVSMFIWNFLAAHWAILPKFQLISREVTENSNGI